MSVTSRKDSVTVINTQQQTQQQEPLLVLIRKENISPRKKLVARWLKDENSQLYCQWVVED